MQLVTNMQKYLLNTIVCGTSITTPIPIPAAILTLS
jgi:hypothetical protein